MIFNDGEVKINKIQVTPRHCDGGELLALLIAANGQPAPQFLWNIGVARAFSNVAEIEQAIQSEVERLEAVGQNASRHEIKKALILKSGLFKLGESGLYLPDSEE